MGRDRWIAVAVMIFSVAAVLWHHRADLIPTEPPPPSPEEAAFLACFGERSADIDGMVGDGVITADQAEQFKGRAEALCRAQTEAGNAPPPPPNVVPDE